MDEERGSEQERDATKPRDVAEPVRNALAAFNAEEILGDPDELEPKKAHPPAINPDSPTAI
jgi:hypothetical protein